MTHTLLITGGAGYIGSHTVRECLRAGYRVVVLDNLSTGFRWAVPEQCEFIQGDVADRDRVETLLREFTVHGVVHFAGSVVVPESVRDPLKYYRNNTIASQRLIEACVATGVDCFVFSSSAAVYGRPDRVPVDEQAPARPISPYGATKLMTEWMLRDVAATRSGFRYCALRYFNVAGAATDGTLGQATRDATHLIKVACEAACGLREEVVVFGDDYDTPDGTGVRDYIHVEDLARAHVAALEMLRESRESHVLNCGYGHGYSVRQVLDTVRAVSGVDFAVRQGPRRAGDPPALVADVGAIGRVLDWSPRHDDLEEICRSAWDWEREGVHRHRAPDR